MQIQAKSTSVIYLNTPVVAGISMNICHLACIQSLHAGLRISIRSTSFNLTIRLPPTRGPTNTS
jgi:hypothetical protein